MKGLSKKLLAFLLVTALAVQGISFNQASAATGNIGTPEIKVTVSKKADSVKITIDKTEGASWYVIEMKAEDASKFTKLKKLKKDGTAKRSYTKKGLADGTYSFRVRAYAKDDTKTVKGSYSEVKTITIGAASDGPALGTIDLSAYDSFGYAYSGIIPVAKGDKWGLIDYSGKEIVPCKYNYFKSANKAGYTILYDKNWNACLFNNKGKRIAKTQDMQSLTASSDGYIISGDSSTMEGYQTTYDFYNYKGKLVKSIASGYGEDVGIGDIYDIPHGYYDGKSIVTGNVKDLVYKKEDDGTLSAIRPFDFGLVDRNGNVTWIDGDGIDEDSGEYLTKEEVEGNAELSGLKKGTRTSVEYAKSAPVDGYFISHSMIPDEGYGYFLRNLEGELICAFVLVGMSIEGDKLLYKETTTDNLGRKVTTYMGEEGSIKFDLTSYYHDGYNFINYGTKFVLATRTSDESETKAVIVDLADGKLEYRILDYARLSMEKYWLISENGKWGYCDHDLNVVKMYDDASEFANGYALVIEDGKAYLINESLEKVKDMGPATGIYTGGEVFDVINGDVTTHYYIR